LRNKLSDDEFKALIEKSFSKSEENKEEEKNGCSYDEAKVKKIMSASQTIHKHAHDHKNLQLKEAPQLVAKILGRS